MQKKIKRNDPMREELQDTVKILEWDQRLKKFEEEEPNLLGLYIVVFLLGTLFGMILIEFLMPMLFEYGTQVMI